MQEPPEVYIRKLKSRVLVLSKDETQDPPLYSLIFQGYQQSDEPDKVRNVGAVLMQTTNEAEANEFYVNIEQALDYAVMESMNLTLDYVDWLRRQQRLVAILKQRKLILPNRSLTSADGTCFRCHQKPCKCRP